MEQNETAKADHSPHIQITMKVDDTTAIGFPVMSKRPFKSMPLAKFYVIPCMVDVENKKYYVLMPKNKWKKGGNRLATTLHRILRAIKNDPEHVHFKAQKLVLIFDNYSENQNNTMLKFWCHIVANDWFRIVEILFLIVGHSHNGGDGPHAQLNNLLLNMICPTLVELIKNSHSIWRSERTKPEFVVLDTVYDWDALYLKCSANKNLSGFTNTSTDSSSVRGWKIQKQDGVVRVWWKQDPSDESEPWRGVDGTATSEGYVVLRQIPLSVPEVIQPAKEVTTPAYYKEFFGKKMQAMMYNESLPGSIQWLQEAAKDGVIPIVRWLDNAEDPAKIGRLALMISDDNRAECRMMTDLDPETFWTTKPQPEPLPLDGHCQDALNTMHGVPCVRYQGTRPEEAAGFSQSSIGQLTAGNRERNSNSSANGTRNYSPVVDHVCINKCLKGSFAVLRLLYEAPTNTRKQKKKSSSSTSSRRPSKNRRALENDEDDSEECRSGEEQDQTQNQNYFPGIALVKITITGKPEDTHVTGTPYQYFKTHLPWTRKSLSGPWMKPKRSVQAQEYPIGDVLAYSVNLGHRNAIPKPIVNWMRSTWGVDQIFGEPPTDFAELMEDTEDDDHASGVDEEDDNEPFETGSDEDAPCDN